MPPNPTPDEIRAARAAVEREGSEVAAAAALRISAKTLRRWLSITDEALRIAEARAMDVAGIARPCPGCGEPLTRRDGETSHNFAKRVTCGRMTCVAARRNALAAAKSRASAAQRESIDASGWPADVRFDRDEVTEERDYRSLTSVGASRSIGVERGEAMT